MKTWYIKGWGFDRPRVKKGKAPGYEVGAEPSGAFPTPSPKPLLRPSPFPHPQIPRNVSYTPLIRSSPMRKFFMLILGREEIIMNKSKMSPFPSAPLFSMELRETAWQVTLTHARIAWVCYQSSAVILSPGKFRNIWVKTTWRIETLVFNLGRCAMSETSEQIDAN